MNFKRRTGQLLFATLMASASGAMAATLLSDALSDLTTYFKAASSLVLRASLGLDSANFDTLPAVQRNSAKTQLETLGQQLQLIFIEQTTLVSHLDSFVKIAKDPSKTAAQRKNYWDNSVLPKIRTVQEAVSEVRSISDKPGQPFSVALSREERLALGDTLAARGAALKTSRIWHLPRHRTSFCNSRYSLSYKVLMANLFKLRGAIDDALRRLSVA
jgi:hypothetical protein